MEIDLGRIAALQLESNKSFQKRLDHKLLRKGLIAIFPVESLTKGSIRRDHKPFLKRLERKPLLNLKRHDGVINRRNGCGTTVAVQYLCSADFLLGR
jgi:hypothetical protein